MQFLSDFLKWYNNKIVVPTLGAKQKMIEFYHNNGIDMLKLECTLPNLVNIFVSINQQIQKFVLLQSRLKICWRRYEKIWLVVFLLSLHEKLQSVKVLYANHQTCANQLLVSMLVSFIATHCVNQCLLHCRRNGSTILKPRNSQLAETNLAPLILWFCRTFNEVNQNAKLRVMSLLVYKINLIASV